MNPWLDKNGFYKPRSEWTSSGNGILYSAIAVVLEIENQSNFFMALLGCEIEHGLFKRTPDGAFGNQSWDDYLGIAAASIKAGNHRIPFDVLCYGITHAFIFDTDGRLQFKDWLGRFVHLWLLMACAAFPWIKFTLWPVFWVIQLTFKPNLNDTSGLQLQWLYLESLKNLGFRFKKLAEFEAVLPTAFSIYYDKIHPFINCVKKRLQ